MRRSGTQIGMDVENRREEEREHKQELKEFSLRFRLLDELFNLDDEGDNKVNIRYIADVYKLVEKKEATPEKLQDLIKYFDPEDKKMINLELILKDLKKHLMNPGTFEELVQAFYVLDPKKTGQISQNEFRYFVKKFNPRMTDSDTDTMILDMLGVRTLRQLDATKPIEYIEFAAKITGTTLT